MFTDEQKSLLAKPLASSHVKGRNQGGRQVSYVEGWHVIAEANRIFGFDAWSRETVDIKCVSEREREIGQNKAPGFSVSYIAKVRVTVGGVVREGCGTGHGIDRDLGQAHESALKEAETDAMKRALMTFGNPFGLALYDKEQANVSDEPPDPDESTVLFIERTKEHIGTYKDGDEALRTWWMSDEQMQARRAHNLDAKAVNELKALVIAKLNRKAAA